MLRRASQSRLVERFYDKVGGGFFDTEAGTDDKQKLGALTIRRKPSRIPPTPAGNSVAATLLLRLQALNDRDDHAAKAA